MVEQIFYRPCFVCKGFHRNLVEIPPSGEIKGKEESSVAVRGELFAVVEKCGSASVLRNWTFCHDLSPLLSRLNCGWSVLPAVHLFLQGTLTLFTIISACYHRGIIFALSSNKCVDQQLRVLVCFGSRFSKAVNKFQQPTTDLSWFSLNRLLNILCKRNQGPFQPAVLLWAPIFAGKSSNGPTKDFFFVLKVRMILVSLPGKV